MASIDRDTAELRWAGYTVTGSGRMVCVNHCSKTVQLTHTADEASTILAGQTCNCAKPANNHQITTLDKGNVMIKREKSWAEIYQRMQR